MHNSVNNLIEIKNQIKQVNPNTEIIAVSKSFISSKIMPLIEHGHIHFGENKVQEAQNKWKEILSNFKNIKLHMIGKLQTNKVKQAVSLFDYIHSVDSIKLAQKISTEENKINKKIKLFIQINIGKEIQKNGILEEDLIDFYQTLVNDLKVDVVGLMCIPPIEVNTIQIFKKMKDLNKKLGLINLSMGMSSDYLEAVKCGSTHVRVGSKIFGLRN
jgi:PLP dependent protein